MFSLISLLRSQNYFFYIKLTRLLHCWSFIFCKNIANIEVVTCQDGNRNYEEDISPKELCREINLLNREKSPGYDLLTGKELYNLSRKATVKLKNKCNI